MGRDIAPTVDPFPPGYILGSGTLNPPVFTFTTDAVIQAMMTNGRRWGTQGEITRIGYYGNRLRVTPDNNQVEQEG